VADVEGRARVEGVVASIHESYLDVHGNKMAEDAVFMSPCVVIIFDEAPRYREVWSKHESKNPIMEAYRDRASSQAETRGETSTNKICCSVETSQMSQTQSFYRALVLSSYSPLFSFFLFSLIYIYIYRCIYTYIYICVCVYIYIFVYVLNLPSSD